MLTGRKETELAVQALNGHRVSASTIAKRYGIGSTKANEIDACIDNAIWRTVREAMSWRPTGVKMEQWR